MNKGIPITMIVSSSFDDIVAISIFGILRKLAIQNATSDSTEQINSNDIIISLFIHIAQIFTGLSVGLVFGYLMSYFNYFEPTNTIWIKFFLTISICICTPFIAYYTNFDEAKYIGIHE